MPLDLSKYKYKTSCSAEIQIITPTDEDKNLAQASLTNARQYFPEDIDPASTPDLLYITFAGYNGGICNRNGHGVRKEDAINLAKFFKNKYIDLEHDRTRIVGNLLGYGFTKHGEDECMTEAEAKEYDGPIDVILSGYIWATIDENLAKLINDSNDPTSSGYKSVSASWEVYYTDYDIGVGSRFIHEAKVITDPDEKNNYAGYLRHNGGKGFDENGNQVYAIFTGDCLPVGLGLVGNPAAFVEGVTVLQNEPEEDTEEHEEDCDCEKCKSSKAGKELSLEEMIKLGLIPLVERDDTVTAKDLCEALARSSKACENILPSLSNLFEWFNDEKNRKNLVDNANQLEKNKNSVNSDTDLQKENKIVSISKKQNMKLQFEDLKDEQVLSTASAADVYQIAKELNVKMSKYAEDNDKLQEEAEATKTKHDDLKKTHDEIVAELEKVKKDLESINEVRASEKIQNDFSARMGDLNEQFELDETKSKVIAKEIKGLSDEDYSTWLEDKKAFLVAKTKTVDETSNASLLNVVNDVQPDKVTIINKISAGESFDDLMKSAFANLTVDKKK